MLTHKVSVTRASEHLGFSCRPGRDGVEMRAGNQGLGIQRWADGNIFEGKGTFMHTLYVL